jgi:hypothetical protein
LDFESAFAFAFALLLAFGLSLPTAEGALLGLMDLSEEKEHLGDNNMVRPSPTA